MKMLSGTGETAAYYTYFEKMKYAYEITSVCVSPITIFYTCIDLHETWYIYHVTWGHLRGIFHKSLP
jgi:hypothetical protein